MRYLEDPDEGQFWQARCADGDVIEIVTGAIGSAGEHSVIEDPFERFGAPPDVALDRLAKEMIGYGYVEAVPPDLVGLIEEGHNIVLEGRLRTFFGGDEVRSYEGKTCSRLSCQVHFGSAAVLGDFYEEYHRGASRLRLIPIASCRSGGSAEDPMWIGIDADAQSGPVYRLATSSEFEELYSSFEELLADLS